jgi:hypothetical protein
MGGTPSAPVDLGQAWHDARQAHKGDTKAAYDAWRQNPGEFSPEAAPYLSQWVQSSAAGADRAFFNPDYARGADKWGPTQAALDRFHAGLTNTPTGVLDLSHIDELRQNLRAATKSGMGVPGADSRVIEKAINGLDQGVSHAVAHPPFFSNSANGPAINKQLLDARAAHAKERTLFGDDAPTAVTGAHGALDASNGPDLHLAGAKLEDALLNKKTGPGLYSHMSSAGLGSTVDDYLRNRLLSGDSAKIDQVMSSPVGKQVFSNPADRAQINTLNASRKAFEAQHGTPEPVSVGSRVASVAKPLAAAGAMGAASHFLGHNPITALGIGAASGIGEKLGEHFFGNPARKELAGAPASFGNRAANVAQPTLDMMTGANAARLNEPDLPGHARGGRVGHQHLVDRLFTHIEKAKKAEKSRTSVLLHQPDEHIAKALNVAQAAI